MVSNPSISLSGSSKKNLHGAMPATIATLCMGGVLLAVANAQFGTAGMIVVGAFALATVLSVWVTALGAMALAAKYPALSALFASSGVRMVAPLVIALVIVVGNGRLAPVETVYYVIPLYLCMLVADVAVWVRENRNNGEVS